MNDLPEQANCEVKSCKFADPKELSFVGKQHADQAHHHAHRHEHGGRA